MSLAIFWFLFAIAAGVYASNRGRSGFGWFLLSLLLSPLLGLIFLAVSKDLSVASVATGPSAMTHVKCPACAEFVLPDAHVCKHCGSALVPVLDHSKKMQQLAKEAEAKDTINTIMGIVFIVALIAAASMLSNCGGR